MPLKRSNLRLDSPVNNFATWNPLVSSASLQDGNLKLTSSSSSVHAYSNMSVTSGKWYFEYVYTVAPSINGGGGITFKNSFDSSPESNGTRYIPTNGAYYKDGSHIGTASTYSTGNVIGVFVDTDAGDIKYYKATSNLLDGDVGM